MSRLIFSLLLLLLGASASAQTLVLKDGTSVPARNPRREGQTVMLTVSAGEVGYPVANIARLDWPEPSQIAAARDLLAQGKAEEAVKQTDPVIAAFSALRDLPGNWWTPAAALKATALIELGREAPAKALLGQLAESPLDKSAAGLARLRLAAAFPLPPGQEARALQACDAVLKSADAPRELDAEAWVLKGRLLLARQEFQPALLAYLHLPTLYYEQKRLLPAALLGSARAYLGLKDEERARRAFQELLAEHPAVPEAAAAKTELQALDNAAKKKAAAPARS